MPEPVTRFDLKDIPAREMQPGFSGKFLHAETTTLAYFTIKSGSVSPPHSHPHRQVVNILEGEMEMTVGGAVHRLGPGQILAIPGDVEHSARALTNARVLDVFTPVREDYR